MCPYFYHIFTFTSTIGAYNAHFFLFSLELEDKNPDISQNLLLVSLKYFKRLLAAAMKN